jgi:hypothetical protein
MVNKLRYLILIFLPQVTTFNPFNLRLAPHSRLNGSPACFRVLRSFLLLSDRSQSRSRTQYHPAIGVVGIIKQRRLLHSVDGLSSREEKEGSSAF